MSEEQAEPIVVFITAANKDEALRLAEVLVKARLVACAQVLPGVESIYRWQGQIERQEEVLLIAKTLRSRFVELEREVRAIHSYETPEIVAAPLTLASDPYREWLIAGVTAAPERGQE